MSRSLLDLDEHEFASGSAFHKFATLVARRFSHPIDCLRLRCDVHMGLSGLLDAIMAIKFRRVLLQLRGSPWQKELTIPSSLVRSDYLRSLGIEFNVQTCVTLPSQVCLPSLTELRLKAVRFEDFVSAHTFFTSCPALGELYMYDVHWVPPTGEPIPVKKLRLLVVSDFCMAYPARHPRCCSTRVVFQVPMMKSFAYHGNLGDLYSVIDACSVESAELPFLFPVKEIAKLPWLSRLKTLTLGAGTFQTNEEDLKAAWPIFGKLTELKLDSHVSLASKALGTLLENCPSLEVLKISQREFVKLDGEPLEPVPECFKSKLKKIVLQCLHPAEVNLDWIPLLLKKATVLEQMLIYYWKSKGA